MDIHSLQKGDILFITNTSGETHRANFLNYTEQGMQVNFQGFGNLEVKWPGIVQVDQLINEVKRNDSYSPRYKATIWRNNQ